jgi:DnaJ family protein C protein 25
MAAASPLSVSLLIVLLLLPASEAIYCDEDDCYDLLGIKQDANASEIRKAYYKLSLKHHPDKNPDPESRKLFVKIANAYEILKDESTREQYDYAIAHPEEVFYNTAQYYRAYYGHKTDPHAVLIGLLLIISAFQYINQLTRYNQAIESVKQTPAYRNRLKALEFERTGGIASKKKGQKQVDKKIEVDLSNEVELQIHGVKKPSVWKLFCVQFILLPYYIGKMLSWEFCWFWRYQVKKLPYAWEDACYLTRTSLKMPANTWKNMDESTKETIVSRRLWERSNMERYVAEMRRESKRRR